jgi:hypothetical protein
MIKVNMTKAVEIKKDMIRAERAPKLAALDVAYMKALEQGHVTTTIAAEKQALRDVTADARIAGAATPDALKALTLDVLLGA